ncbi:MAG: DUF6941 family protein [Limisphaerales bacterium]
MKLEIFTFCEFANVYDGALCISGITDGIYSPQEPLKFPRFCIVYRIRFEVAEEGKHTVNISIMDEDGKPIIPAFQKPIVAQIPKGLNTGANIGMANFNGVIFPKFGEYSLDLVVDGKMLSSQPLHFQKLESPI